MSSLPRIFNENNNVKTQKVVFLKLERKKNRKEGAGGKKNG